MKKLLVLCIPISLLVLSIGCGSSTEQSSRTSTESSSDAVQMSGQSGVKDETSAPNIVQIAVGSNDHTTLVAAVKAGELVDALSNAGPFTLFAPTNAAFDKLPAGTVEDLVKPQNKDKLTDILGYHTYVGVIDGVLLMDGAEYDMVFGGKVKITKQGDKIFVNGSEIVGTIKASNGVVHVINDVLLPK